MTLLYNNLHYHIAKLTMWVTYSLLFCVIFLSSGCSEQPSSIYNEYQHRLANALNAPLPEHDAIKNINISLPQAPKQLTVNLSILQLAQLNNCALSTLVAGHNSQLGKVATPASRLIYQIKFIQAAPACLSTLDDTSKSYQQIKAALQQKQSQMSNYFNQFIYTDEELKHTWQLTSYELDTNLNGFTETKLALEQLVTIKQQIHNKQFEQINSERVYASLGQLHRFNFNQALISAARKQIDLNNQTSHYLSSINLQKLCNPIKNKKQANIVSNIFKKYYLAQLQPYQAQLTGALEQLMPYYEKLWLIDAQTNKSLQQRLRLDQPRNLLNSLKKSTKQHVSWWQTFYKKCEISPT